jgi:hypothetical protein
VFTFTVLFVTVERCLTSYQLTCIAVRNMQQQQQDAVQTEGCQNQANGSFVNDKTLDDLGRVRFSNRSHTQGKIKPTFKLTPASTLYPTITVAYLFWHCDPTRARVSSCIRSLDHTQRRTKVNRTPLDERSARRRDFYLTTRNSHNRHTSLPPAGIVPVILVDERSQTCALHRAVTGSYREVCYEENHETGSTE